MRPRPTQLDTHIIEEAARNALPRLKEDMPDECEHFSDGKLLEMLRESLRNPWGNGYRKAREWEASGWDPDEQLVNFLQNLDCSQELRAAVLQWVSEGNAPTPPPIGTRVEVPHFRETVQGEITFLYHDVAVAQVYCESLGHVREGMGTHGLLIAYEKLKTIGETP